MAGKLQPLDQKFSIVDDKGNPSEYFIRWAQQRQKDIGTAITLPDLKAFLTSHMLREGDGIALTPDGDLGNSPSIAIRNGTGLNFDAMHNLKIKDTAVTPGAYTNANITVDQQGRIILAASGSGGGGGRVVANIDVLRPLTDFIQDNTSVDRTIVENAGKAISMIANNSIAVTRVHGLRRAEPATPYRVAIFVQSNSPGQSFYGVAFGWSNGTSHELLYDQGSSLEFAPFPTSNSRGGVGGIPGRTFPLGTGFWLGLRNDGVNWIWEVSGDGGNFTPMRTVAKTAGYNQIYVGLFSYNGSLPYGSASVLYYDEAGLTRLAN